MPHKSSDAHNKDLMMEPELLALFDAIILDDVQKVFEILESHPEYLDKTNPDGACPVHFAFLLLHNELGLGIISKYPECALNQYGEGKYQGENCLHITIVHRQFNVFSELLDLHPGLLNHESTGEFFQPGGDAYFGGYPFLFAVSTNQSRMVQKILDTRSPDALHNNVYVTDSYGNTALHLAVIHDLPDMYDFILEQEAKHGSTTDDPLSQRANDEKLTPLALAAAMGRVELFQMIITRSIKTTWLYGPVKSEMVPLRGLEQPVLLFNGTKASSSSAAAPNVHPVRSPEILALECVCAGQKERVTIALPENIPDEVYSGRLKIAQLKSVSTVVEKKWEQFGRKMFWRRFVIVVTVMILWTIAIIMPNSYTDNPDHITQFPVQNGIILFCESCVFLYVIWNLSFELLRLFRTRGQGYFRGIAGVVAVLFWLRLIFCILVLILVGLRAALLKNAQIVFTAIASVVGWLFVLAHLVSAKTTGRFILIVKAIMTKDVAVFSQVYVMVLLGFTTAVFVVRPLPNNVSSSTVFYFRTLRDMIILGTVGEFLISDLDKDANAWILNTLIVLYLIFQVVIMMNMLIAMLQNTYDEVDAQAEGRFIVERSTLMTYFEMAKSLEDMYVTRCKYAKPLPEDDRPFDADLYLEFVVPNDVWKYEVVVVQHQHLEGRRRRGIAKAEAEAWGQIERQMRDEGIKHQEAWEKPLAPYASPARSVSPLDIPDYARHHRYPWQDYITYPKF